MNERHFESLQHDTSTRCFYCSFSVVKCMSSCAYSFGSGVADASSVFASNITSPLSGRVEGGTLLVPVEAPKAGEDPFPRNTFEAGFVAIR